MSVRVERHPYCYTLKYSIFTNFLWFSRVFNGFPKYLYLQWNPDECTSRTTPILLYIKIFNFHQFSTIFLSFPRFSELKPTYSWALWKDLSNEVSYMALTINSIEIIPDLYEISSISFSFLRWLPKFNMAGIPESQLRTILEKIRNQRGTVRFCTTSRFWDMR